MARASKIDWDVVDARVRSLQKKRNLKSRSIAFLSLVLEQYFPALLDENPDVITDGADDRGIDALHVTESGDYAEIFLFQCKYRETIENTDKTINENEALKCSEFLSSMFNQANGLKKCNNVRLIEGVRRVWALHEQGRICRYRIVFCSNDQGISSSAKIILDHICQTNNQVSYEFYGVAELLRDLASTNLRRETGYLQVVGKEVFDRTDGDIRGLIASIDANSYVDLIQTSDGRSVKRYLFEDNLRVFLGSNSGYNQQIITTASSPDSHLFWYLNNGITITCRNFSYNKGHANPKIKLDDFQIVNGAQTSHSLIEASRLNSGSLENVVLMVRVYATDRNDVVERVAVATNSQARIQSRDLRANHPILKKLELAFLERGYFFERKRNMYSDKEANQRVDALKLGQIIMAFYLQEPDRARAGSDEIFDQRFSFIFHDSHDIDELCRLYELQRRIEIRREAFVSKTIGAADLVSDEQYLVYGYWHILFAARLLLNKKNLSVPHGSLSEEIVSEALSLVARSCNQQRMTAHYQLFRSPKTKERIRAELETRQSSLFDFLDGVR